MTRPLGQQDTSLVDATMLAALVQAKPATRESLDSVLVSERQLRDPISLRLLASGSTPVLSIPTYLHILLEVESKFAARSQWDDPSHWLPCRRFWSNRTDSMRLDWNIIEERSEVLEVRQRLAGLSVPEEAAELLRLVANPSRAVSSYLAAELARLDLSRERTAILVVAAEHAIFDKGHNREVIKQGLKSAAAALYNSREVRWQPAVWSAIRRYASMLDPQEASTLAEFLYFTGEIDARQVTLQAIRNVLAGHPPQGDQFAALRDQVFRITDSALRPESLRPGAAAALAMSALSALAALADERLTVCVRKVLEWNRSWFIRQVRTVLEEIQAHWPNAVANRSPVSEAIGLLVAKEGR